MNAIVLPHRKVEDWKYSDLRGAVDAEAVSIAPTAAWSIVAAKGDADIDDLPAEVPFGEHGAMAPVATSLATAGPSVRVRAGESAEIEFELTEPGHGRALIVVEDRASLTLIEKVPPSGFSNIASEIVIGKNASLTHLRILPGNGAVRVSDYAIAIAEGGTYRAHLADFGGTLSRTELHVALEGEGAEAHIFGVGVMSDRHADVTTHVSHASGKTRSTQLFKCIAAGHARGVYQGKVTVAKGANGSDSRQTAKGLLLEDRAEIDLKPELEIFADDVKCAHGAAVGDLDAESLFYLRSRGIPESEARALLMRAFIGDAIDQIKDEKLRQMIWEVVDRTLERLT
jgi:Fe-S cluster assembly protein SufD